MSVIKPLLRFRDESVGGIREGGLSGEVPDERTIYYQARIKGKLYSGIRVFHRLALYVTFWRLDFDGLEEELLDGWKKVLSFVWDRETELVPCYPDRLLLVYGEVDFSPFDYSTVRTVFGSFSFVSASAEEVANFGLPFRDLAGTDLALASKLFPPPYHSYLSLKALNLIGSLP